MCVDFQNQSKVNSEKKHCEPVGLVVGNTLIAVFFFSTFARAYHCVAAM